MTTNFKSAPTGAPVSPAPSSTTAPSGEVYVNEPLRLNCHEFCETFRHEFSRKNLWIQSNTSYGRVNWIQAFGDTRYSWFYGFPFVLWRLVIFLFALGTWLWSICNTTISDDLGFGSWWYFLTHWLLTINMFTTMFWFISAVRTQYFFGRNSQRWKNHSISWDAWLGWLGTILSMSGGFYVVVVYWSALQVETDLGLNVLQHGAVWACLVIDFLLIGLQPFLLVQTLWVALFGVAYGWWTLIFHWTNLTTTPNHEYIYKPINWNTDVGLAFFFAFLSPFVIQMPMYFIIWLTNFLRYQAIYRRVSPTPASGTATAANGPKQTDIPVATPVDVEQS